MLKAILLFILGLILLIKGGDWFVDGATSIAHKFKIPEIIIGATVVSIGTTLPEVMVSASSAIQGHSQIAYGNAIGSIICNSALISAITIAICPSDVDKKTLKIPVAFFFFSAVIYSVVSYTTGYFSRIIGLVLLAIFVVYIVYNVINSVKNSKSQDINTDNIITQNESSNTKVFIIDIIKLVVGAVLITIGANLLIDNGTIIAENLGVPESVIALTFVALGTSLPELVTAISSLIKGHGLLSLGNIIGANLFNLVLVSGLSITLKPFSIPNNQQLFGINSSLILDIPIMLSVMAILTLPSLLNGKLKRIQGILLLIIYSAYCVLQFIM